MMGELGHMHHNWRIMYDKKGSALFITPIRYLWDLVFTFELISICSVNSVYV